MVIMPWMLIAANPDWPQFSQQSFMAGEGKQALWKPNGILFHN